ncbi:hypothetical protein BD311DRAFT_741700 [Dichomitus squalens]|uniref:Acyl-CoA N-acyltransferase n=1 Tax=Dichomitus squalens TaxID=114155 RepID=A0A4Q9MBJ5_9APHY|nr:hypothetical protein BD311DRAFT_741700 [Dichomitus squalens]
MSTAELPPIEYNFYFPWRDLENDRVKLVLFDNAAGSFLLLAILDKASPGEPLAGITGFLDADPANLSVEVGVLVYLLAFQRRGLTSAAVALLLQYCLDVPRNGGLGLRLVTYASHIANAASVGFARRMGFVFEGVARWEKMLVEGKPGNGKSVAGREGDPRAGMGGRDTAWSSLCWDDWEGGRREAVCRPEYAMRRS